ncbi:MAG: hypothetical protein E6I24_10840 [Chloroflexi bacterium]|nr:MAG: hypothetical protein E6I24_10840 [Chloroflexota bacterium]
MAVPGLSFERRVTRREVLKTIGGGAVMLGAADLLAACGEIKGSSTTTSGTITIGYVSPQTGALAGFATGDNWVLGGVRQTDPYKNGFKLGSKTYGVNIVVKDTQSNPDRASQVARELIQSNKADLILTSSTPETTNPVADVCEANGVPCVSTIVPWEAWFFARGGKPGTGFNFTTMFFFGMQQFGECFIPMWNRMNTNKVIAFTYPNDADGNAFRDSKTGRLPQRRWRRLYGRHPGLQQHDRELQAGRGAAIHQRSHSAGLQHDVEAGGAAGVQAEAGHGCQSSSVPGGYGGARRPGQQCGHRRMVDAVPSVPLEPDRPDLQAVRRCLRIGDRQAMGAEHRIGALAL